MDNQLLAKVLFTNKLATKEQIQQHWGLISADNNIAKVLVGQGVISEGVYSKLMEFVAKVATATPATATPATATPTVTPIASPSAASPSPQMVSAQESTEAALPGLESNNPYGSAAVEPTQVQALPGLEATRVAEFAPDPTVQPLPAVDSHRGPGLPGSPSPRASESSSPDSAKSPGGARALSSVDSGAPNSTNAGRARAPRLPNGGIVVSKVGGSSDPTQVPAVTTALESQLLWARGQGATDALWQVGIPLLLTSPQGSTQVPGSEPSAAQMDAHLQNVFGGFSPEQRCSRLLDLGAVGRFRVRSDAQGRWISARLLTPVPTLEDLALPAFCAAWLHLPRGLLLFAGPAASGRSTCVAAFAQAWLAHNARLAVYAGDPAEMEVAPGQGILLQKSVGHDAPNLQEILKSTRAEEPGLVVIDALQTPGEILAALRLADEGALVVAACNGQNVLPLLLKIPESFVGGRQNLVRNLLADSLKGILCRHLIPGVQAAQAVPVYEGIHVTPAIASLIRRNDISQLPAAMASLKSHGIGLDDSLEAAVQAGLIAGVDAWSRSSDPRRFQSHRPDSKKRGVQ